MLEKYEKLDGSNLIDDFNIISRMLKNTNYNKRTRLTVKYCRDYVLIESEKY